LLVSNCCSVDHDNAWTGSRQELSYPGVRPSRLCQDCKGEAIAKQLVSRRALWRPGRHCLQLSGTVVSSSLADKSAGTWKSCGDIAAGDDLLEAVLQLAPRRQLYHYYA
jgi:hypothetical protein